MFSILIKSEEGYIGVDDYMAYMVKTLSQILTIKKKLEKNSML